MKKEARIDKETSSKKIKEDSLQLELLKTCPRQLDSFLGVKFWSGDFFGFFFLPPFDHLFRLKFKVPSLGHLFSLLAV